MMIWIFLSLLMGAVVLFSGFVLLIVDFDDDIIENIIYKIFISSFFLCIFFTFMLIASFLFLTLCK